MREIHSKYGIDPSAKEISEGTYETTYDISEEQTACLSVVKQTGKEQSAPKVVGSMDMERYAQTFKLARERILSLPARLHCTI